MPPTPTPPDPIKTQRTLVYALTGILCLTGLVLSAAFKDPCARGEGASDLGLATCHPSLGDRLPDPQTYAAMAIVLVAMIALYELRWIVRVYAVAALGSIELVIAVLVVHAGMPMVLGLANGLLGVALIGCAVGIQRNARIAWSYACAICAIGALVYFFGSSKVRDAMGWHLAWAVLPALALFLPVGVSLALSPPGGVAYGPFAKKPLRPPATARR